MAAIFAVSVTILNPDKKVPSEKITQFLVLSIAGLAYAYRKNLETALLLWGLSSFLHLILLVIMMWREVQTEQNTQS